MYNQKVNIAGFIGDVHAEDALFESSITFLKHHGIRDIYCLGDFCDGYGNVDKIISIVQNEGIISVQGNHDIWCMEGIMRDSHTATRLSTLSQKNIDYLKRLPKTAKVMTYSSEVMLCHGILDNEMAKVNPDDCGYFYDIIDGVVKDEPEVINLNLT